MSASDAHQESAAPHAAYPQFELSYLFDDPTEPTEVTVFLDVDGRDLATNWITIDSAHAIPLERVR